jgi:hypothetical protein
LGVFILFTTFGTAWWYFIGQIGWASGLHSIGRASSGLAAVIAFLFAGIGTSMCRDNLRNDSISGILSGAVILQYVLVGALILGAWSSGICSVAAMLGILRKPSRL